MEIRRAEERDLDEMMRIYDGARKFMVRHGNASQWKEGYPSGEMILRDIAQGISYVCTENGEIMGVFTFSVGEDPTYREIWDGNWHMDQPYGVIHRLASSGKRRGVADACVEYCKQRMDYLRIDTHRDNFPMQNAIEKHGFQRCGIIRVADGSERIAYDCYTKKSVGLN